MPNTWLAVDSNLPDLSRVTNPKEQIVLLFNYMVELTQQLRYSLNNLSATNWNATALNELKTEFGDDALKAVTNLENRLNSFSIALNSRMSDAENEITHVQSEQAGVGAAISQLQEDTANHEQRLGELEETVGAEGGLEAQLTLLQEDVFYLQETIDTLVGFVEITETGWQLGAAGKQLHLLGDVYINGVLLEQGGPSE